MNFVFYMRWIMKTIFKRIKAFGKDCTGQDFYYDFPMPDLPKDMSAKAYAYGYVEGQLQRHIYLNNFYIEEYEVYHNSNRVIKW